jgi:hypothetical protein
MLLADAMSLTLLWEHRRELHLRALRETPAFARWSPVLLVAGVLTGTLLLRVVPASAGRLALAVVVLGFVLLHVRRRSHAAVDRPVAPVVVEATTFAGGLVDGWLGTGGVLVAIHLAWRRLSPGRFVVTILPYFLASDAVRAASYAVAGYWSRATVALFLAAAPFAAAGYLTGVVLRRRLAAAALLRGTVLALLALYGLALVVRALTERP